MRAKRTIGVAAAAAALLVVAAMPGAAAKRGFMPIECGAGTLEVTSFGHLRDIVIVGYRESDNALRVVYSGVSKDDGPYEFDTVCPDPGKPWKLIKMKLESGGDLVQLDGEEMDASFEEVPASIRAEIDGQGTIDELNGHAGVDVLRGGSAFDLLRGYEGDDVLAGGEREDKMLGGRGADLIKARDPREQADTVLCGAGRDKVLADEADELRGCEKVERR